MWVVLVGFVFVVLVLFWEFFVVLIVWGWILFVVGVVMVVVVVE